MIAASISRAAIVAEARSWLGTPYHHQASAKGIGCDCLGLVRGVWRAFYGAEPEALPAYSRDWGSVEGKETLIEIGRRHLVESDPAAILPGDVVVFRIRQGMVAKHAGIISEVAGGAPDVPGPDGAPAESGSGSPGSRLAPSGLQGRAGARFIHAQDGVPVSEVALSDWWRRRIAAAFRFPGVGCQVSAPTLAHSDPRHLTPGT